MQNPDRTWRNPNLLVWHGDIWLIDHGAALYFHHNWPTANPARPYDAREHVLIDRATAVAQAHATLAPLITTALLAEVAALVPPGLVRRAGRPGLRGASAGPGPGAAGGDPPMTAPEATGVGTATGAGPEPLLGPRCSSTR